MIQYTKDSNLDFFEEPLKYLEATYPLGVLEEKKKRELIEFREKGMAATINRKYEASPMR